METWCEDTLIKLKVSELKEVLKKYKLPIYGIKIVLIQRLLNFKDDSNKLNGQEESQEVNCSASTPMSSQTSFSYSLHRIEHAISDIDEDVSEENSPIIKKKDKKKRTYKLVLEWLISMIILILIILGIYKYWTEIEKFETEDLAYDSLKSDWKYINNYITNELYLSIFKVK